MTRHLLSALMLASSLVLVLPPTWCCIFANVGAEKTSCPEQSAPSCCKLHAEKQSAPKNAPPPPSNRCPCTDRQTVLTSSAVGDHAPVDAGLVAILTVIEPCSGHTGAGREVTAHHHPPNPIHAFYCVWLC
jgi:hypothetical protein